MGKWLHVLVSFSVISHNTGWTAWCFAKERYQPNGAAHLHLVTMPSTQTRLPRYLLVRVRGVTCLLPKLKHRFSINHTFIILVTVHSFSLSYCYIYNYYSLKFRLFILYFQGCNDRKKVQQKHRLSSFFQNEMSFTTNQRFHLFSLVKIINTPHFN